MADPAADGDPNDALIRQIYNVTPKNAGGQVPLKALSEIVEKMRYYSATLAPNIFDAVGISEDDVLSYEEFQSNITHMVEELGLTIEETAYKLKHKWLPSEIQGLQQLFHVVDVDGGGSITRDELTMMIQLLKPHATDADVSAAMAVADSDVSGDIDFQEFTDFIATMKLEEPLGASIVLLREFLHEQEEGLSERNEEVLSPTERTRRARLSRLQSNLEGTAANEIMAEEMTLRRQVESEEDEAWEWVSSSLGRTFDEMATAERIERQIELERKRREFMAGGADTQRSEITLMREQREKEEAERRNRKTSESRYKLEDRINVCQNNMHCFGQQFKLLRQYLNKGIEHVRLEADREFGDLRRTLPAHHNEISSNLDRTEQMLATVGRALIQESIARHSDAHKEVLQTFKGDPDFTWLRGTHAMSSEDQLTKLKERASVHSRLSAMQINFSDPYNLHAASEPPTLSMKVRDLKKFLWACFRHYSSDGGFGYTDFQKLLSDCKLEVAGSAMVLWHNAVHDKEDCEVLGMRRTDDEDSDSVGADVTGGKLNFRRFANLLLLLACERFIASPSSCPQYKLECFLLHELLPLLPQELVMNIDGNAPDLPFDPLSPLDIVSQLPTIHGLIEEHHHVILPHLGKVRNALVAYLRGRALTARSAADEEAALNRGMLNAPHFMYSMGLAPLRDTAACRLPVVKLSPACGTFVRSLCGDHGAPVMPLKELGNFLAYQMPAVGRKLISDAVCRSFGEVISATYPALSYHVAANKFATSLDPIPFPVFLALCAKTAMYTSIAAALPAPVPFGTPLTAASEKVYSFFRYLTHTGHYVLNL